VGHCHCATDATQIYAYFGPPITILESYSRTILVRAIVRDAGGYSNGLEVLDEITYDSFGNVLNETNPAAGDRFKFTALELDAALSLYY
jgi:hypothetical protein